MIRFLNSSLIIEFLTQDFQENKDAGAQKIAPRQYKIYLPEDCSIPVLVHELWHIYFDALNEFDSGQKSCEELSQDIYAYTFENLVRDALEALKKEKYYD